MAVLENEVIQEVHVERDHRRGVVGNIYAGRVSRVLPGMQAAFVEVGLERAAFLYVDDVVLPGDLLDEDSAANEPELDDVVEEPDEADAAPSPSSPSIEPDPADAEATPPTLPEEAERPTIEQLLRDGQPVTVQVAKAPIGTKGARVTTYITLPGRYVVYMPTMRRIGVSRKITSEAERKRLKELLESVRQPGEGGFIARTVCEGLDEARIRQDVEFLRSL
ncbi:MAG: ribonuclease E/G, partial [Myxococcota bacterium]